jgi:predicted ATPase/transcriptional regulator with XRE-family HTH domain
LRYNKRTKKRTKLATAVVRGVNVPNRIRAARNEAAMDGNASFGYWVRRQRKALDLTQAELARRVGCAEGTIRMIEADARRPSRQIAARLADHLAIAPPDRTTFIQSARAELRADRLAPPVTFNRRRTNLPAQPTRLIGRVREVEQVCTLLRTPDVRLVTLTGPGGVGKTRLALQAAVELLDDFADGIYVVNLAPIADPNLLASVIAQTLDIREVAGRPLLNQLKDYLHEKHILLLLDNFEQVVVAATVIADLLATCPRLIFMVTSREVLRLRGEKELPVPPLAVPDLSRLPPLDALAQYSAVELFIARARDMKNDFAVTSENAPAVAEICYRLDGLPLALELAAARIKLLAPQALLGQLDDRLKLLTRGARDLPTRQQTLRRTIDWSYQLLATHEQTLFQRLAVFAGGCTLEAAAAVGNSSGAVELLNGLEALVDKHLLIQPEGSAEPRFRMLETIREYAVERLVTSGEADTIRRRHAHYFMELAEAAEPHLYGTDQRAWVRRLEVEHDNLRAALAWAIEHASAVGLRLAGALGWFWHFRGYHREGRDWLLHALDQATDGVGANVERLRAKALNQAGYLAMWLRDLPQATALLEQSVALWHALGEPRGLAHALCDCGVVVYNQGNFANAHALLEASIAAFRQVGEQQGLIRALFWHGVITCVQGDFTTARASAEESIRLGREVGDVSNMAASMSGVLLNIAFRQGEYTAAQSLGEEGLRLSREVEDKPGIALALSNLGSVAYLQGQYDQAKPRFEEQLQLWRALGSQYDIAWSVYVLGYVALRQNDRQHAAALFAESMALCRELSEPHGIARCLAGLAEVAEAAGQIERAAQLLGATQVLLAASGRHLEDTGRDLPGRIPITSQAEFERHVAAVRAALGDAAFAAAWAKGRAMPLEQAIASTLDPGT